MDEIERAALRYIHDHVYNRTEWEDAQLLVRHSARGFMMTRGLGCGEERGGSEEGRYKYIYRIHLLPCKNQYTKSK